MSKKSGRIAELIDDCAGQGWDPHYLGFFACFNRGLYYEAHDVLEELWLADRTGPNYAFYKGLIQLAGAFVHLQKERLRPAIALFDLAASNLARYPEHHDGIHVPALLELIRKWRDWIAGGDFEANPLRSQPAPCLDRPK